MFCVLGRGREGADNLDFCNSVDLYFQLSVTTQTLFSKLPPRPMMRKPKKIADAERKDD